MYLIAGTMKKEIAMNILVYICFFVYIQSTKYRNVHLHNVLMSELWS